MNQRKPNLIGTDYFALLESAEDRASPTEDASVDERRPIYTGRPCGRAICPACGNEETRNDEHGGYACGECGFTNGAAGRTSSESGSDSRDCYELMTGPIRFGETFSSFNGDEE